MRKLNFCILVVLVIGLTAGVAAAQELRQLFPINVPFNFVVGNKSFPAGQYDVIRSMGHPLIMIKDWQSKNVACETAIPSSSPNIAERSALHLHRYGTTYPNLTRVLLTTPPKFFSQVTNPL